MLTAKNAAIEVINRTPILMVTTRPTDLLIRQRLPLQAYSLMSLICCSILILTIYSVNKTLSKLTIGAKIAKNVRSCRTCFITFLRKLTYYTRRPNGGSSAAYTESYRHCADLLQSLFQHNKGSCDEATCPRRWQLVAGIPCSHLENATDRRTDYSTA